MSYHLPSDETNADPTIRRPIDKWSGRLFLSPGLVLYLGPGGTAQAHAHHAVQLVCSFDEPCVLDLAGDVISARAALIASGVRHSLDCDAKRMALVLIEPHGVRGAGLEQQAQELARKDLGGLLTGFDVEEGDSVEATGRRLLAPFVGHEEPVPRLSESVEAALRYLEGAVAGRPRLEEAAKDACLSPSRLTHVFSSEVGMPFRRYVLWMRLRLAAQEVGAGANLTRAAISAGFADSAHLSRVFRQTFGLPPSALLGMTVVGADWPS